MKYKLGDLVEIYHPELEEKVVYRIIYEDGKYKGMRYPIRMAQDAGIDWLIEKGELAK